MSTTDAESLRALLDELLEMWEEHGDPRDLAQPKARRGQPITSIDVARMECVLGLSRHTYETAYAIRLLLDNAHVLSAVPLIRLAYECALTSVWLVQSEGTEAVKAFMHEYARSNRSMQLSLRKAMSATFRENADSIADSDVAPYRDALDNAQRFDLICEDLTPGGADAYVYYRALSAFSHAGVRLLDLYFEPDPAGGPMPAVRPAPREPFGDNYLLFMTCASLVWAGRPITYLAENKVYRSFLRRVGNQIGVTSELKLSQKYYQRHATAKARNPKH
ncbi:DUF5677 domain-containing protein [Leucobacter chromiireducens]|uniref:Uncharacterized protein n=1 Tax=Leucobacter chromiireducens subsp. solipictus TaxID=398235 RepID=A0ABS1SI09_9MICO|nr:DUF5677 domain-containing protein [Leucobacter chromiireducens]MBL3679546.1 hypothetical protein [Leucobacter chromiireducens subsp. solipictus]